jgi:hypothetical protein
MKARRTIYLVFLFIFISAFSTSIGYYWGKGAYIAICETEKQAIRKEANEFRSRVEAAFPGPAELYEFTGEIKNIDGGNISIEVAVIGSIPPAPGEPTTEIRDAVIATDTKFVELAYRVSEEGMPGEIERVVGIDAFAIGDFITVRSYENIKDAMSFPVYRVEKRVYDEGESEINVD